MKTHVNQKKPPEDDAGGGKGGWCPWIEKFDAPPLKSPYQTEVGGENKGRTGYEHPGAKTTQSHTNLERGRKKGGGGPGTAETPGKTKNCEQKRGSAK